MILLLVGRRSATSYISHRFSYPPSESWAATLSYDLGKGRLVGVCEFKPLDPMPSRGRAKPSVRAAEARLAQADAAVMAKISSRVPPESKPPLDASAIARLAPRAVLDELDGLMLGSSRVSESAKELCSACLDRCDAIWSGDDICDHDVDELPHSRALLLTGVAMWLACERGELSTCKVDRKLFVYACMLLPSVLMRQQNGKGYEVRWEGSGGADLREEYI